MPPTVFHCNRSTTRKADLPADLQPDRVPLRGAERPDVRRAWRAHRCRHQGGVHLAFSYSVWRHDRNRWLVWFFVHYCSFSHLPMCRLTPPCVEQTGWLDRYFEYESRVRVAHLMNGHVFGRYECEKYGGQLRCSALLATSPPSSQSSKSPTTCSGVCQLLVCAFVNY